MKVAHLLKEPDDPNGPLTSEEIAELELLRKYANGKTSRSLRRFIDRTSRANPYLASISGSGTFDMRSDSHAQRISRTALEVAQDVTADHVTIEVRVPKSIAATLRYIERTTAEAEDRKPRSLKQVISIAIVGYGVAAFGALTINPTVFSFFRRAWNRLCRREGVASKYKMDGPRFPIWSSPDALPGTYGTSLYSHIPPPEGWLPLFTDEELPEATE